MTKTYQSLFSDAFLKRVWALEYQEYLDSGCDTKLLARLQNWATKDFQKETAAEQNFVQQFFVETWGYIQSGSNDQALGYTIDPKHSVEKAGQKGGTGEADLALGQFGQQEKGIAPTPQVLCEFKDIRSNLESPQKRKGNNRSPVKQCADYLREARGKLFGNEAILPTWGIVTDMNEFRLYWWTNMPVQYQRFILTPRTKGDVVALTHDSEEAKFQRFLFTRIFHAHTLLSYGGKSQLERALQNQWVQEKELENSFYKEYRAFRENLFNALVKHNPNFPGTKGKLVRLSQRILDRLIFILYCEDMGKQLNFPPNLLRDVLRDISKSTHFEPNGSDAWAKIRDIFRAMAEGLTFAGYNINRFNGGLYAADPEIESLHVPTSVFCAKGQDRDPKTAKATLLYLSANYNFGVSSASGERVINLYTLGRIFEQSITELEIRVAEEDNKASIGKITKRKRDGVYYTPEWVTGFIVKETIGSRLEDLKAEIGWNELELSDENIKQATAKHGGLDKRSGAYKYREGLLRYRDALQDIKIVDPACGSGAFLIQALEFLINERKRITEDFNRFNPNQPEIFDQEAAIRDILSNNIYGVDINSESVEITRLALWLHTALPNRPLSNLSSNILCGNSLVGEDFYNRKKDLLTQLNSDQKERVNTFDWEANFTEVFNRSNSRFDCVIGNPPYVKLQNFRTVDPQTAEYLVKATGEDGLPLYASTQTGNFDLYLPFIEKGIHLLNDKGYMGYIAPSVWLRNEYGEGLRTMIHRGQHLDRWLDFVSYQVFDEAITYTALQFYRKAPTSVIRLANAPKGGTNVGDWESPNWQIRYDELTPYDSWVLLPIPERRLFEKLYQTCRRLDDVAQAIIVGIQTSADHLYHLQKIAPGRYLHFPKKEKDIKKALPPVEVKLEDEIMRPLISGEEAKRYESPRTDTYLLFPYDLSGERPRLWTASEVQSRFPQAWSYLRQHETVLRERESGKFDNDQWYQFGRNQNIDKQETPKLAVPRLVRRLFCAIDAAGEVYLDNVDVGGIIARESSDLYYIGAIINHPLSNFLFTRISKPFQNDFWSANKQFIAPLPIPAATPEQKKEIGIMAEQLQNLTTVRRDKLALASKRLQACMVEEKPTSFLWPTLPDATTLKASNPKGLKGRELTMWAKAEAARMLKEKLNTLDGLLTEGAVLDAEYKDGELRLLAANIPALQHIFMNKEEGEFLAAQWCYLSRITNITEKTAAKAIVSKLCNVFITDNSISRDQFLTLMEEIKFIEQKITRLEAGLNQYVYKLYALTPEEIRMVETEWTKVRERTSAAF